MGHAKKRFPREAFYMISHYNIFFLLKHAIKKVTDKFGKKDNSVLPATN
jgi:hypothetical protein